VLNSDCVSKPWASARLNPSLSDHQTMESQSRRNESVVLDIHTSGRLRATQSSCVFDGSYSRLLIGTSGMPVLHRHHCELKPPRGLVGVMIMVTEGTLDPEPDIQLLQMQLRLGQRQLAVAFLHSPTTDEVPPSSVLSMLFLKGRAI